MAPALLRRLTASVPDADLFRRFIAGRDEAAFTELVRRHGPAVYRVCRRLVGPHADDAFQATFLILATRATAVREPGAVGGWLVGVAGRVARQMRKASHRRTLIERASGGVQPRRADSHPLETADLARVLDEELTRLPDRLRGPAVLCLVEGRTQEQAAADLGGSVRTVRRRLDEARALLRLRLERRGVVPAVATALVAGAGDGLATVPASLTQAAVGVAFDFLAGGARTAPAAVIAKGVTMTLFARKLAAGLVATTVGLVGLGVGFADDGPKPAPAGNTIPPQNLPAAPPVKSADPSPAKPGPAAHVTANFQVYAPTREVAAAVAAAAEKHRKRLAEEWLGKELPAWPTPCPVTVEIKPDHSGGVSTFKFDAGRLQTLEMKLFGPLPKLLDSCLPHEVMHCVLATHFGRALPRWADEGLAVLAESAEEQSSHDIRCREMLNQGRGIQLSNLFKMTEYPRDMAVLFAQGYSVCRFLLSRPLSPSMTMFDLVKAAPPRPDAQARKGLLTFLANGIGKVGWDGAANGIYGFASVDELQEAWLQWLNQKPAAPRPATIPPLPTPRPAPGPQFTVANMTPAVARALVNELTAQWRLMGQKWISSSTVLTPPAKPIRVTYYPSVPGLNFETHLNTASGENDRREVDSITLAGPLDRLLNDDTRMVAVKGVFVTHFGHELPDWASAGLMAMEAHTNVHNELDQAVRKLVAGGQAVRLSAFFKDAVWHTPDTKAQGHSVLRFLLIRPVAPTGKDTPEHALTDFLSRHRTLGWDGACQQVYGFKGVDDLEAQWIAWLKTPGSKLTADPPPAPPQPPRIPATQVDADRIGRIVIEGNTVTAERVILNQLGFAPGQLLRHPQLEKARANLIRLGIFDSEDPPTVEVIPGETGTGFKDIRVRVKETKTGMFSIGPGLNDGSWLRQPPPQSSAGGPATQNRELPPPPPLPTPTVPPDGKR